MPNTILMNISEGEECRVALVSNGILFDYFVDRPGQLTHVGDVYRGVITNVESAIQAGFVDIGYKKNAFLHISDTISAYNPGVRLTEIYGTEPVEVTPVESINFDEVDWDDEDDDEDENGAPKEFTPGIEAHEIEATKPYTRSREEQGISETVAMERRSIDGSGKKKRRRGGKKKRRSAEGAAPQGSADAAPVAEKLAVDTNTPEAPALESSEKAAASKKKTTKKAAKPAAKPAAKSAKAKTGAKKTTAKK
ncbi:MAG: hypothetical protein KDB07_12860, partial [Planctomycetes bacterium]|nr:hypothetical protein [Planctomycetota bacterium]